MKVINGNGLILGRVATYAAKAALLGQKVFLVNAENIVISGNRKSIMEEQHSLAQRRGKPDKGIFYQRQPDRFVRRVIKKMMPPTPRGAAAIKNVRCYIGVPEELKKTQMEILEGASSEKIQTLKYITIGQICKEMGGTWH